MAKQTAKLEKITPKMAEKLLENNVHNRNLRQDVVDKYARSMRLDLWESNGESIIVASDGSVLDGQHRLWAVLESGVMIEEWIIRGVDPNAYKSIDNGLGRSLTDHATLADIKNAKTISGAVRHIFRCVNDYTTMSSVYNCTPTEMIDFYYKNPDLDDSVPYGRKCKKFIVAAIGAAYHYMFHRINADKANAFFDALATGEFSTGMSAVRAFRERLITAAMKKERRDKLENTVKIAMMIKAWNAFYSGKDVRVIRFALGEKFPKVKGLPKKLVEDFADRDQERFTRRRKK